MKKCILITAESLKEYAVSAEDLENITSIKRLVKEPYKLVGNKNGSKIGLTKFPIISYTTPGSDDSIH